MSSSPLIPIYEQKEASTRGLQATEMVVFCRKMVNKPARRLRRGLSKSLQRR
jgi:hypothetical protein